MCKLCVCMWCVYYACLLVCIQACVCVYTYVCELCVCAVGVCGVCMHRHVCTCVCACVHLGMPVNVYVCLCVACVQACVCILVHFPGRPQVTLLRVGMHMCILSINCSSHPSLRFLGCKGFPGACMTGLCTRCQPHPNMQLPPLLSNPHLPNTSLHPSETSTSPTSAYQVRNYSSQGSPPCSGSQHCKLLRNEPKASDTPEAQDGSGGSPPPFLLGLCRKQRGSTGAA